MGPISLPKVVDVAWEKLWTDGKRPVYSSDVSIADQNARVEQIMKEKDKLVAQAGAIAEQSQRDADSLAASQKRRKDRLKREKEVAPALEEWVGHSEAELTRTWGLPATSTDRGPVKTLVYRRTHSEFYDAQIGQVGNVAQYEKRETQLHCDLTLEFRGGVLEDPFYEWILLGAPIRTWCSSMTSGVITVAPTPIPEPKMIFIHQHAHAPREMTRTVGWQSGLGR